MCQYLEFCKVVKFLNFSENHRVWLGANGTSLIHYHQASKFKLIIFFCIVIKQSKYLPLQRTNDFKKSIHIAPNSNINILCTPGTSTQTERETTHKSIRDLILYKYFSGIVSGSK